MGAMLLLVLACSSGIFSAANRVGSHAEEDVIVEQNVASNLTAVCELVGLHCTDVLQRLASGKRCDQEFAGGQYFLNCHVGQAPFDDAFLRWDSSKKCEDSYTTKKCSVTVLPGGGYYLLPKSCRTLHLAPRDCERMATLTEQFQSSSPADKAEELGDAIAFASHVLDLKKNSNTEWMNLPNIRYIINAVALSLDSLKEIPDGEVGDKLGPLWIILLSYCQTMYEMSDIFGQELIQECPTLTKINALAPFHPALAATRAGLPLATGLDRLVSLGFTYLDSRTWERLAVAAGSSDARRSWELIKSKARSLVESAPQRGVTELELALQLQRSGNELYVSVGEPEGGSRRLAEMSALRAIKEAVYNAETYAVPANLRALQKYILEAEDLVPIAWIDQDLFTRELFRAKQLAQQVETRLASAGGEDAIPETSTSTTTSTTMDADDDVFDANLEFLYASAIEGVNSFLPMDDDEEEDENKCEEGYKLRYEDGCALPTTLVNVAAIMQFRETATLKDGATYRCCCATRKKVYTCSLMDVAQSGFFGGCKGKAGVSNFFRSLAPGGRTTGATPRNSTITASRNSTYYSRGAAALTSTEISAQGCMVPYGTLPLAAQCEAWMDGIFRNGLCMKRSMLLSVFMEEGEDD